MYQLDVKAARNADSGGSSIKELGKYVGEFTQAKVLTAKSGALGIEFSFKSTSGQKARLSIYTQSASGEHYQGYDILMAIMTCMRLRNIAPVLGQATKYDPNSHKDVEEECEIFPDLCNPIGVLIETEDYEKQNGSTGTRMVLKNVFQASTELTATEILDRKTEPLQLERLVSLLKHKPLKTAQYAPPPPPANYPSAVSAPAPAHTSTFDADDSDIPF
jgi:hypothetical protein